MQSVINLIIRSNVRLFLNYIFHINCLQFIRLNRTKYYSIVAYKLFLSVANKLYKTPPVIQNSSQTVNQSNSPDG